MTSFKDLYTKFRSLLQESWLTNNVAAHFGPTATLDSMFRYLWSRPEAQQELVPPPGNNRISRKGASEAEKFRNEGNRLYREKKLDQALLAYNYSILAAPYPGLGEEAKEPQHEGLPLAFANRSAVLYEMTRYKEALADAERALSLGYPPSKRHRLHERRAKCLQAMGKMEEAKAVLEDTLNALATMSLDDKEATTVRKNITNLKTKCDSKQTAALSPPPHIFLLPLPALITSILPAPPPPPPHTFLLAVIRRGCSTDMGRRFTFIFFQPSHPSPQQPSRRGSQGKRICSLKNCIGRYFVA